MKHTASIVLLIMGVVACDEDVPDQRIAECTADADSDVDCVPIGNTVGHTYVYNGSTYSCAWYNHSTAPSSTYVPPRSVQYAARSTPTAPARASPPASARGGFGGSAHGGGS